MATLTVQLPGLAPVPHLLKDDTITIGRMKGNSIVIEDDSISLMHARITRKGGEFYLKDLNSTNGTRINGQPISEARLQDMDRVRFADVNAQFQAEPAAATTLSATNGATLSSSAPQSAGSYISTPSPRRSDSEQGTRRISRPATAAPGINPGRLLPSLTPYLGAVAALIVVSMLGWRFILVTRARSNQDANSAPSAGPAPAPSATGTPSQPASEAMDAAAVFPTDAHLSVEQLVTELQDQDPSKRRRAAVALHAKGAEARDAIPALRQALNDPDPEVQMWCALALINNQSYDPATIPILLRLLQNDNPTLREVACLSLGLIPYEPGDRDIVAPALAQTAGKDTDETVRKAALSALNLIAPELVSAPAAH